MSSLVQQPIGPTIFLNKWAVANRCHSHYKQKIVIWLIKKLILSIIENIISKCVVLIYNVYRYIMHKTYPQFPNNGGGVGVGGGGDD